MPRAAVQLGMDANPSIDTENTRTIQDYCLQNHVPIIGEIPFSPAVRQALVARKSPVDFDCGAVSGIVERMWLEIEGTDIS